MFAAFGPDQEFVSVIAQLRVGLDAESAAADGLTRTGPDGAQKAGRRGSVLSVRRIERLPETAVQTPVCEAPA